MTLQNPPGNLEDQEAKEAFLEVQSRRVFIDSDAVK